jgi:hypothetical protein
LQVRHNQRIGKKVKVCRNAMDHVTGDGALLIRESGNKCVLAEEIDDSRDASGRRVDIPNYLIGKERGVHATRGGQPAGNICCRLVLSKNRQAGMEHDALAQLAKGRLAQLLI